MRMCRSCGLPVTLSADDGTSKHKDTCPRKPDRDAYIQWKRLSVPGLVTGQEAGMRGEDPLADLKARSMKETLKTIDEKDRDGSNGSQD